MSGISEVSGIEIDIENYMISCVLLDLFDLPLEDMINEDVFSYDLSKLNANKVFMNLPLGLRMFGAKLEHNLEFKFEKSIYKNYIKPNDLSWFLLGYY